MLDQRGLAAALTAPLTLAPLTLAMWTAIAATNRLKSELRPFGRMRTEGYPRRTHRHDGRHPEQAAMSQLALNTAFRLYLG
jgi:hypothetical protein